jgi:hypothetical protein
MKYLEQGVADVWLLLLREMNSASEWAPLSRLLLVAVLFLALRHLWSRRRGGLSPDQPVERDPGLWLLAGMLAAWAVLSFTNYQGPAARRAHLQIAQSAPVRVTYGDAAHAPVIQVFTARGCGPCIALEQRLRSVIAEGYAVQYIPGSLDGADWNVINAAMCEIDPKAGFEQVFGGGGLPAFGAVRPGCRSGVGGNESVLRKLAGNPVFPTLIMPDGLLLIGAPSESRLRSYLHAAAPLDTTVTGGGQPL